MTVRELHDKLDWSLVDEAGKRVNDGKEFFPDGMTVTTWRCHLLDTGLYLVPGKEKEHESARAMLRHYGIWGQAMDILQKAGLLDEEDSNGAGDGSAKGDGAGHGAEPGVDGNR